MIKLKSILEEISNESKKLLKEGTRELTLSFDGEEILALSKEADEIEVDVNIDFSWDEGDVVIEEWDITGISIIGEDNKKRDADIRFLHPTQLKRIEKLVDNYINKNENKIEDKIYNGESEY